MKASQHVLAAVLGAFVVGGCTGAAPSGTGSASPAASLATRESAPGTISPEPDPTRCDTSIHGPVPVSWQDVLPAVVPTSSRWIVEPETPARGYPYTLFVFDNGAPVGGVHLSVYPPWDFSEYDFEHDGLAAIRAQAEAAIAQYVADQASSGGTPTAIAEPLREIEFGGGRGIRTAFSDVETTTGEVIQRVVLYEGSEGRGLWSVQIRWPPEEVGILSFDDLATQRAFEAYLEELVAVLRLPSTLPCPTR
jgi:hypothetical protein